MANETSAKCASADLTEIESILLSDNFTDLMHESLEVQLHMLLGPAAINFLKPTFRDGAKKSLDPLIDKYKTGECELASL